MTTADLLVARLRISVYYESAPPGLLVEAASRIEALEAELVQSQAEVERLKRALAFISIRSGAQAKGNASSPHTTTTLSPPR